MKLSSFPASRPPSPPSNFPPQTALTRLARRARRAFTLVELLVVIGIIALLISILLPALNNARNKAYAVNCASNMRQLYLATLMFANEHKGALPRPSTLYETPTKATPPVGVSKNEYLEEYLVWAAADPGYPGGRIDFEVGAIWRYVQGGLDTRMKIAMCPGDRGEASLHGGQKVGGDDRNFSYSYNANLSQQHKGRVIRVKMAAVRPAADKIMIYEELGPNDALCFAGTSGDDMVAGRHGNPRVINAIRNPTDPAFLRAGLGNHCFFDGHVEALSPLWLNENRTEGRRTYAPLTAYDTFQ